MNDGLMVGADTRPAPTINSINTINPTVNPPYQYIAINHIENKIIGIYAKM